MKDKRFGGVNGQGFEMRGSPSSGVDIGGMCVVARGQLHGCEMGKVENVVAQLLQPVECALTPFGTDFELFKLLK